MVYAFTGFCNRKIVEYAYFEAVPLFELLYCFFTTLGSCMIGVVFRGGLMQRKIQKIALIPSANKNWTFKQGR